MDVYQGQIKQVIPSGNFYEYIVDSIRPCEKARDLFVCGRKQTLDTIQCVYKAEYHCVFGECMYYILFLECVGDICGHEDKE